MRGLAACATMWWTATRPQRRKELADGVAGGVVVSEGGALEGGVSPVRTEAAWQSLMASVALKAVMVLATAVSLTAVGMVMVTVTAEVEASTAVGGAPAMEVRLAVVFRVALRAGVAMHHPQGSRLR